LIDRLPEPCKKAVKDAKIEMKDIDEVILVGGMSRMPSVIKKVKEIFGKEPNKGVNPDEVVAMGAAIQAGVLGGDVHDITLLDVTPLSLGIETLGSVMTKLIERNTTIPVEKKQVFSTAADNQTSVEIHVLQGEREMAADNKTLGRFMLDGIPMAPRGVPQVEVTYSIDANGILNVSAMDKASGKKQHITITASTGLSDDEVEKMVAEAAAHAAEDKTKKERAEVKNDADSLCFNTEKMMKDAGDKIAADQKEKSEKLIKELRDLIAKDDFDKDDVKKKTEELTTVVHEISTKLYEAAGKEAEAEKEGQKSNDKGQGDEGTKDSENKGDEKKEEAAQEGEVVK
jgi:molecular chaperone DnaK